MADNALQSVQKLLQDLIAPDVRETKVRVEELEKRMDAQFASLRTESSTQFESVQHQFGNVQHQFDSMRPESEAQYRGILAAISEMKANADTISMREVAALRERVAVLEAQQRPH